MPQAAIEQPACAGVAPDRPQSVTLMRPLFPHLISADAAARESLGQLRAVESQLQAKSAEADRWQARAEEELAQRAQQAQQLEAARAELARMRRRAQEVEVRRAYASSHCSVRLSVMDPRHGGWLKRC